MMIIITCFKISCKLCNRFGSDDGLIHDSLYEVYKSKPRPNVTKNTELLHGLSLACVITAVLSTSVIFG